MAATSSSFEWTPRQFTGIFRILKMPRIMLGVEGESDTVMTFMAGNSCFHDTFGLRGKNRVPGASRGRLKASRQAGLRKGSSLFLTISGVKGLTM